MLSEDGGRPFLRAQLGLWGLTSSETSLRRLVPQKCPHVEQTSGGPALHWKLALLPSLQPLSSLLCSNLQGSWHLVLHVFHPSFLPEPHLGSVWPQEESHIIPPRKPQEFIASLQLPSQPPVSSPASVFSPALWLLLNYLGWRGSCHSGH